MKNKSKKSLSSVFREYSCKKYSNGFCGIFENYLLSISESNPSILEIGVGTVSLEPPIGRNWVPENMYSWKQNNPEYLPGNSLRGLREYLDTGNLYGVDIQKDCLIFEDRIETRIFDSRNPKESKLFVDNKEFDLIIDDSDKDVNIRIITFDNFYSSLKDTGYYVFEEIIDRNFLEEYFTSKEIPFLIIDSFMVFNKLGNFEPIIGKKVSTTKKEINPEIIIKQDFSEISNGIKFSIHNNVFADKGFYINLEKSVERKENVELICDNFEIDGLHRFNALTDEMIQYSCTKSHLEVFKIARDNNFDTIFVAEDDFDIIEKLYSPYESPITFKEKISLIKNDLDNVDWDIFLFGCNPKTHIVPVTENVGIVYKSTGAWAYLIKRRAYEYLIENLNYKRDYIAIDDYLPIMNDLGFTTLTSIPLCIGHAVGFTSTLQPGIGPTNYTDWIKGNYHQFLFENYPDAEYNDSKIEKDLTICLHGTFHENYVENIRHFFKNLPKELRKCKFLVRFIINEGTDELIKVRNLGMYLRDTRNDLNVTLTYTYENVFDVLNHFVKNSKTEFLLVSSIDTILLKKDNINYLDIIDSVKKNDFINVIGFSDEELTSKISNLSIDKNGEITPFISEDRISKIPLVVSARFPNKLCIIRKSKLVSILKEFYGSGVGLEKNYDYKKLVSDYNIKLQKEINENLWGDIKDLYGIFTYGNIGDSPYTLELVYSNVEIEGGENHITDYLIENQLTEND